MSESASSDGFPPGVEAVLVTSSGGAASHMHRPNPLDPSLPACLTSLEKRRGEWQTKTHPRQVVFNDRCTHCPWPDVEGDVGNWTCPGCRETFPTSDSLRGHWRQGGCQGGDGQ